MQIKVYLLTYFVTSWVFLCSTFTAYKKTLHSTNVLNDSSVWQS